MNKMYGTIMQRISLDDELFIFKPIDYLEGELCEFDGENHFVTKAGGSYYLASDINSLDSQFDHVVLNIIDEEDLLENYGSDSIEGALSSYFEECSNKIYFGICDFDLDKIAIMNMDLYELLDNVFNKNDNIKEDISGCNFKIKYSALEHLTNLRGEDIKKILCNLKNNAENHSLRENDNVIADLKFIEYNKSDNDDTLEMSSEYINEMFNTVCSAIKKINKYDELKEYLNKTEELYISFASEFINNEPKELNKVFLKMAEAFKAISLYPSAKKVKEMFNNVYDQLNEANKYAVSIYKEYENKKDDIENSSKLKRISLNIKEIKARFDEIIIGQEEAKKDVIQAVFMNQIMDDRANKNNCLLVGPTGSGKTLLAECVAKTFDMPIEIIDTTQLTTPGYVGADIEDFLARLLASAKGDLEKAEEGIVVFDEIDKKGSTSNGDVGGRGVLNTLLPFIGGTKYDVVYNNRKYIFDTSKLTIFATGAFTTVQEDITRKSIGFGEESNQEDIKYKKLTTEDFVKKANMPAELIGRFSVISQLSGHNIDSLKKILTSSKTSALLSEKEKLEAVGIELLWNQEYLDAACKKALTFKTGARSLKRTVEESIKEARWEALCNLDIYKSIILTEKTVQNNLDVILVDNCDNKHNLKDIIESSEKKELAVQKELVYKKEI